MKQVTKPVTQVTDTVKKAVPQTTSTVTERCAKTTNTVKKAVPQTTDTVKKAVPQTTSTVKDGTQTITRDRDRWWIRWRRNEQRRELSGGGLSGPTGPIVDALTGVLGGTQGSSR